MISQPRGSSGKLLWIAVASLAVASKADCGSRFFPRKLQLVSQMFTGTGTTKTTDTSGRTSTQQQSFSGAIDMQSYSLRFFLNQTGEGASQETGYIMNMHDGTSINMAKDGDRARTCTIDQIPGVVKMFMKWAVKKAISKARSGFKCIGSESGLEKFEMNLDQTADPTGVLPEGSNGTVDVEVTEGYLWKNLKSVSSDPDDGKTEVQMQFSSQAGAPTEADLKAPAYWDCKPAAGTLTLTDSHDQFGLSPSHFNDADGIAFASGMLSLLWGTLHPDEIHV